MYGQRESVENRLGSSRNREEMRAKSNREELVERISRCVPHDGFTEPLKGLRLNRVSMPTGLVFSTTRPSFCVIAQGGKEIHLGMERYRYDPYRYLLATMELPAVSEIPEASPECPYLSLRMDLEPASVASVMLEAGIMSPRTPTGSRRAIDVNTLDGPLLDATVRLLRLTEASTVEARVLRPLVMREIILRLLTGAQSERLQQIAVQGGHAERIARAIERLRTEFDQPLRVESLAREIGMSTSGFHEHFKAVTAMSPLQFQKQVRLQEARRLMLAEDMDAATAGYRVGYEDASHFSREYKRLFGKPPMRDIEQLRSSTDTVTLPLGSTPLSVQANHYPQKGEMG